MATSNPVGQQVKALIGMFPAVLETVGANVMDNHPLWSKISKTGNKRPWAGEAIRVKMWNAKYNKAASYTGYDTIDTTAKEPFTVGDFEMGGYASAVSIDGMTMEKFRSAPKRLFEMLGDELNAAYLDMAEKMSEHFLATTNDAKGIISHYTISDATTTLAGVSAGSTWGGTTTASGAFATQGLNDMLTLWDTLSQYQSSLQKDMNGTDSPDIIVTTQSVRRSYWAKLEPGLRYTPGGKGDVKLDLTFMGVPLMADTHVASGCMHFINTKHLWLYVSPRRDFTPQDDVQAMDQDAFAKKILWNGQVVTNARRFHGKLTSIS